VLGFAIVYGRWIALTEATVPDGPGLFQVRSDQGASGLVAYPAGRSAMVYYGADDDNLAAAVARFRAGVDPSQVARLFVRFAAPDPRRTPLQSLAESLRKFTARFGAPPIWNATP
jgi:hypothetical protein